MFTPQGTIFTLCLVVKYNVKYPTKVGSSIKILGMLILIVRRY